MKLSLGAVLLATFALAASACGSSHRSSPGVSGPTVSSSRLVAGGAVQCTATVRNPVEAGHDLGIVFTFHNLTKHSVNVPVSYGGVWVVVKSPDGTTYDTRIPLENEQFLPSGPIALASGATTKERLSSHLRVRWEGPLSVTPGCGMTGAPTMRVAVKSPGFPPSPKDALADVVAATGHLLDHCRPRTPGVSVVGRIDPPSGTEPPLPARCSISVQREPGFYAASVLVLAPPTLRGVHIQEPYGTLSGIRDDKRDSQAVAWEFVVTRQGATSVDSAEQATSRQGVHVARAWVWSSAGAKTSAGMHCGAGSGGSGGIDGPVVTFVSVCGR